MQISKGLNIKALSLLLVLSLTLPSLLPSVLELGGPGSVMGENASRAGIFGCPESMPPPEVNGVRRGDWKINCEVTVISYEVHLAGDILINFGGSLHLKNVSMVEQVPSDQGPFHLVVNSMATLNVEKSTLKVDYLEASNSGDIFITTSTVRTRGGLVSHGGLFTLTKSTLNVFSDSYGMDTKAQLNISPKAGFIDDSTIMVQGANGQAGNSTTAPESGGMAQVCIFGTVLRNLNVSVIGGSGGKGWDSTKAGGQNGGWGGDAIVDLIIEEMDSVNFDVTGGWAGKGGWGISPQIDQAGGNGGRGGTGGLAMVRIRSEGGNITSSEMIISGGTGGAGGGGGTAKGADGGDGGRGGSGGPAVLSFVTPWTTFYNTNVTLYGGTGGRGGSYGKDYTEVLNGLPGVGGAGGSTALNLHIYDILTILSSQLKAWGGVGAEGGIGWQYGGDAGPGGNATISLFAGGNLTIGPNAPQGPNVGSEIPPPKLHPTIATIGGDGGKGGQYELGVTGSEKYMGRAGPSGDAKIEIQVLGVAQTRKTTLSAIPGRPAQGREPLNGVRTGVRHLIMNAPLFTVIDSTIDTMFEGQTGASKGVLRNTSVVGEVFAYIAPEEKNALFEVWWSLSVNFTPMFDEQSVEVNVYRQLADELAHEQRCIIRGSWDRCSMSIQGEVVTWAGMAIFNHTIQAETDDRVLANPISTILRENKGITLNPGGNFYAPQINLTYPEEGATFTVKDLATGMTALRGTAWSDLRNPPSKVTDAQIELLHWRTGTMTTFDNRSGVSISSVSSSVVGWTFMWDLRQKDGYTPRWPTGPYRLCVRAFDGALWSDDKDTRREGTSNCINIVVFQEETKVPVMTIPNSFIAQLQVQIPEDGNYVEVIFETKEIYELGASKTYYRFQWDFDSDDAYEWAYIPSEGSHPPPAKFIYTRPGIYTARLLITDINGDITTVDTQVYVSKAVKQQNPPVSLTPPSFCLPSLVIVLILLCFIYLGTVLHEGFRFSLLRNIMVPLDRRMRKTLAREDHLRREVSDYTVDKPGRFFGTVRRDLEMDGVTLARVFIDLEDQGYVVFKADGTHIRLISTRKAKEKPKKGLRPHQRAILKSLIRHPWQTAGELATEVHRSVGFVSRQLYKLERNGTVLMTPDPVEGSLWRVKTVGKKADEKKRPPAPKPHAALKPPILAPTPAAEPKIIKPVETGPLPPIAPLVPKPVRPTKPSKPSIAPRPTTSPRPMVKARPRPIIKRPLPQKPDRPPKDGMDDQ